MLKALLFSSLYGVAFGCLYSAAKIILNSLFKLILLPYKAFLCSIEKTIKKYKNAEKSRAVHKSSALKNHLFDCAFFVVFGVCFLLLQYVLQDGIFRVYTALSALIFFALGQRFLGTIFSKIYSKIFSFLYQRLKTIMTGFMLPIAVLAVAFCRIFYRIFLPILRSVSRLENKIRLKNKKRRILRSFKDRKITENY